MSAGRALRDRRVWLPDRMGEAPGVPGSTESSQGERAGRKGRRRETVETRGIDGESPGKVRGRIRRRGNRSGLGARQATAYSLTLTRRRSDRGMSIEAFRL